MIVFLALCVGLLIGFMAGFTVAAILAVLDESRKSESRNITEASRKRK